MHWASDGGAEGSAVEPESGEGSRHHTPVNGPLDSTPQLTIRLTWIRPADQCEGRISSRRVARHVDTRRERMHRPTARSRRLTARYREARLRSSAPRG